MLTFELNSDQRREVVNTAQRFQAWRDALARVRANRGSMVWSRSKGRDYLLRSAYDKQGRRRQVSLGPRGPETERIKAEYERARAAANERLDTLKPIMARQAAVNRALGLGRVPSLAARILRALDEHALLGAGIRVLGTNALHAYEASAGVHVDAGLTTTEDVDLLLDARHRLSFFAVEAVEEASLLRILWRIDKSFERLREPFRAVNRDGYLVDLIKPLRSPPWHENAPAFEAVAIDERGEPLRIVTSDPRVFAAHKFWMSTRSDREPVKRQRDRQQAKAVAALVTSHFQHLPFEPEALRMLPKAVVAAAAPLFEA